MSTFFRRAWVLPRSLCLVGLLGGACTRGYEPVSEAEVSGLIAEPAPHANPSPPSASAPAALPAPAAPATPLVPATGAEVSARAGGLSWSAAPPLVARRPAVPMRAAEYAIAGEGDEEAVLTVFHFGPGMGGSVADNVARWAGQLRTERGEPVEARTTTRRVGALPVTVVEAEGQMSTGMPGAPQPARLQRARLLGAIVEGPEGLVFFKLSGPPATVDRGRAAFDALLASLVAASR